MIQNYVIQFIRQKLEELINSLANGLCKQLGKNGIRISRCQREKIAITKAFYRDTLLVLDEVKSNLDNIMESKLIIYFLN